MWRQGKMKLKQRVVISGVLATGTLILLTQSNLILGLLGSSSPVQAALPHADALHVGMQPVQGHLNLVRKDLDISNYTSEHRSPEAAAAQSSHTHDGAAGPLPGRMDSVEVLRYAKTHIFTDDTFKQRRNLERLTVLADMLRNRTRGLNVGLPPPAEEEDFPPRPAAKPAARIAAKEDLIQPPPPQQQSPVPGRTESGEEVLYAPSGMKLYPPHRMMATDAEVHTLQLLVKKVETLTKNNPPLIRKPKTLWLYPEIGLNRTSWQRFHNRINQYDLYNEADGVVDKLLHDLTTQPIVDMEQKPGGTQLKLTFYLANKGRSIFKPMRFPREQADTLPDHFYFSDYERHHAEIAAFHLDRVLGFHRVPPTIGRMINVTYDVKRFADTSLTKTFFTSPAGNICFHGECDYYCDTGHSVCGHPDMLEGSMAAYLPTSNKIERTTWRHPWRRSYHKRKKAAWESDPDYCDGVRDEPPYNEGRRLLDLMDLSVFDFLQGNLDRHHYETLSDFDNFTMLLHLDNGRGFGRPYEDDLTMSILAPIYHCCLIRYSTLKKLLMFDSGDVSLAETMRRSLAKDPVAPILPERHLAALDRRVRIIFKAIYKCFLQSGGHYEKIIKDDGF